MSNETPTWATKRLENILEPGEKILLEVKGRVEENVPSGFASIFFWIFYVLINYVSIFFTMFVRKTAWMVITDKRLIILTNEGVNFPFWVIPFSRKNLDYVMYKHNIASANSMNNFMFWVIRGKGFVIETTGSLGIIFNGVNSGKYQQAQKELLNLVGGAK